MFPFEAHQEIFCLAAANTPRFHTGWWSEEACCPSGRRLIDIVGCCVLPFVLFRVDSVAGSQAATSPHDRSGYAHSVQLSPLVTERDIGKQCVGWAILYKRIRWFSQYRNARLEEGEKRGASQSSFSFFCFLSFYIAYVFYAHVSVWRVSLLISGGKWDTVYSSRDTLAQSFVQEVACSVSPVMYVPWLLFVLLTLITSLPSQGTSDPHLKSVMSPPSFTIQLLWKIDTDIRYNIYTYILAGFFLALNNAPHSKMQILKQCIHILLTGCRLLDIFFAYIDWLLLLGGFLYYIKSWP